MSILRGSALEILGHCHNMCGIHQVIQLLLDSKTQQLSKIGLKLVMTSATICTTATPYHTPHQMGKLATGMCCRLKAAPRTARTDARSVSWSFQSAIFSSMMIRLSANTSPN
jgi:hypothetical protein